MTAETKGLQASRLRAAAYQMLLLADEIEQGERIRPLPVQLGTNINMSALTGLASRMHSDREGRRRHFASDLFGEPAWDMLLYLFVMAGESRQVPKKVLQSASGVPATTALRWIEVLESLGLIFTKPCKADNRVKLLALSQEGKERMTACLSHSIGLDQYQNDIRSGGLSIYNPVYPLRLRN